MASARAAVDEQIPAAVAANVSQRHRRESLGFADGHRANRSSRYGCGEQICIRQRAPNSPLLISVCFSASSIESIPADLGECLPHRHAAHADDIRVANVAHVQHLLSVDRMLLLRVLIIAVMTATAMETATCLTTVMPRTVARQAGQVA
jgi:hypothetical protein